MAVHASTPGDAEGNPDLDEVLVIALVSKTVMPIRVPTGQVFSHKLVVFATDSFYGSGCAVIERAPDMGDQVRLRPCARTSTTRLPTCS